MYKVIHIFPFARHTLTGHVGEEEDALVEAVVHELVLELLQDGHPDTEREGRVAQQQRVPQVEDLVEREHVWNTPVGPSTRRL